MSQVLEQGLQVGGFGAQSIERLLERRLSTLVPDLLHQPASVCGMAVLSGQFRQLAAEFAGLAFQRIRIGRALRLCLQLADAGRNRGAFRQHFIHELRQFADIAVSRGDPVDFRAHFPQRFQDGRLGVEGLIDVALHQAGRGGVHVLLGEQHHGAGLEPVGQRAERIEHGVHGMDQVLLGDHERRPPCRLGLGLFGRRRQNGLLGFDLGHERARGQGVCSGPHHACNGRPRFRESRHHDTRLFECGKCLLL